MYAHGWKRSARRGRNRSKGVFRVKVLQVNCVYGEGSTGKITRDIHRSLLARGHESVVCYGRGADTRDPGVIRICSNLYGKANNLLSRITGLMYGGCLLSTWRLIRIIQRERPDVVHLQCINGYFVNIYRLLSWLKKQGIKTVLTLHAEFMYTGNCGHAGDCNQWKNGCKICPRLKQETKSLVFDRTRESWSKMQNIYHNWNHLYIVACSEWIRGRVLQCGHIRKRHILTLHNGIDNDSLFYPRDGAEYRIRKALNIEDDLKIILFVAPAFSEAKGFDLLLELVDSCRDLPFHFILVGEDYTAKQQNVTVLGKVDDQNYLAELYSAADALVICSRFENYPTVCLEAISCGTPVAGFHVGGVAETISNGMGGTVAAGDINEMKCLLLSLVSGKPRQQDIETARRQHHKNRMAEAYLHLYNSVTE